ncbi:MAG: beta strand repeat-containing protein, partial [Planctomycetia bacterium]
SSPTATTTFAGSGDVVTVSGTVEAASLAVDSPGYSFQGGTISLANATVTVNTASTSIASVLAGSAGLVKSGTGSLSLSGVNTYVGLTNLTAGRLFIASDAALGAAANDLAIAGTLATTANISLGSGRDLTGAATLDIAAGTTLTVAGSSGLSATTLVNSGTLDLQGATRAVGTLTFGTAATVNGSGAISLASLSATAVTSGTALIAPSIAFTSNGNKTVEVGSGGTLVLNGDVAGTTGRIAKSGAGTLIVTGSNSTSGYQLGVSGTTPTNGGTLVLNSAAASGTAQLQLNVGTLQSTGSFTFANGLSIGGRTNGLAVLGGTNAMTFSGTSNFFRGTNTTGELRLDVNNQTTLAGTIVATGGSGTASGITLGGIGALTINGDASLLVDAITLQDTLDLLIGGTLGSAVTVAASNAIGGDGTILGSLSLNSGAGFIFDATKTLTVNGTSVSFGGFGISDLIGFSAAVPDGSYTLIDGLATINTANLQNLGLENAVDLGGGRSAYFTEGSLVLQVVPEPSAFVLAGLGVALAAAHRLRRRV